MPLVTSRARGLQYQDDTYLFSKASVLADQWPALEATLASGGHRVRWSKCSVWAPLCDEVPTSSCHIMFAGWLAERIPRARGGMTPLGGAVEGELAVGISRGGVVVQSARAPC